VAHAGPKGKNNPEPTALKFFHPPLFPFPVWNKFPPLTPWRLGGFGNFCKKNSSFQLPYQRPSSSADGTRELFNGSNGSASLVNCTRKKNFAKIAKTTTHPPGKIFFSSAIY